MFNGENFPVNSADSTQGNCSQNMTTAPKSKRPQFEFVNIAWIFAFENCHHPITSKQPFLLFFFLWIAFVFQFEKFFFLLFFYVLQTNVLFILRFILKHPENRIELASLRLFFLFLRRHAPQFAVICLQFSSVFTTQATKSAKLNEWRGKPLSNA